jgi:hypothetical protein
MRAVHKAFVVWFAQIGVRLNILDKNGNYFIA